MSPLASCFQDVLVHGQDIRYIRKTIGGINPNYQVFLDTGSYAPDDFRKTNYVGWGTSHLASLMILHKRVFDVPKCKIHEWRTGKDRRTGLGRGRVLWIKSRTSSGKTVNIVNVSQTTSNKPGQ